MKLVNIGKPIKNQPVVAVINTYVNIEIKTIKSVEKIQFLVAIFVLNIMYSMRYKTFRRKHGKMSRKRRAGEPLDRRLYRQTTADANAMEQGYAPTAPPIEQMNMLGRSNTNELNAMEQGYAPTAPPIEQMNMLGRSNTTELNDMEEGNANPHVAIDVEPTPDIEMGLRTESGGRKKRTRKGRKVRKSRKGGKGGKRRKSHRR
jgi:hypothetical protein